MPSGESCISHRSSIIRIKSEFILKLTVMLLILQKYKFLMNFLGLDLLINKERSCRFAGVGFIITSSAVILLSLGNVIVNTDKINEDATNSIIASLACVMALVYTAHMLINRVRFNDMENELQDIVNESKCCTE